MLGSDYEPAISREAGAAATGRADAKQGASQIEQYAWIRTAVVDKTGQRRPRGPDAPHDVNLDPIAVNRLVQRSASGSCVQKGADHFFHPRRGPGRKPYGGRDRHDRYRASWQARGESCSQPSEKPHHDAIETQAR